MRHTLAWRTGGCAAGERGGAARARRRRSRLGLVCGRRVAARRRAAARGRRAHHCGRGLGACARHGPHFKGMGRVALRYDPPMWLSQQTSWRAWRCSECPPVRAAARAGPATLTSD